MKGVAVLGFWVGIIAVGGVVETAPLPVAILTGVTAIIAGLVWWKTRGTWVGECPRCGMRGAVEDADTGEIVICPDCREEWRHE